MLAWIEQIKYRWLGEQPNHIRVATKSYNIKLGMGITWINVNHSSSALERSVINNWEYKHLVSCPVLVVNL